MNKRERNDLLVSWITISLAFAMILGKRFFNVLPIFYALPTALLAVGTGFVFHELAHRYVARKFGIHAEFRAWNFGLVLALASAALVFVTGFGIIFAAPGAVYIFGNLSRRENGLVSVAGPLTNLFVGLAFLTVSLFMPALNPVSLTIYYAAVINFFLAFFNMLPIYPLDGAKVFAWNPAIWSVLFFVLLGLVTVF